MPNIVNKLINNFKSKTFSSVFSLGGGDFLKYGWDKGTGLKYYEKSLYLHTAINKRAEKVAQTKFVLFNSKKEKIENKWTELLRRPNSYQTGGQFWGLAQKYYDIHGAFYILKNNNAIFNNIPESLTLLKPEKVAVEYNSNGITGFKYTSDSNKVINYKVDDIIYIYRPDPRNPFLGESLFSSAIRSIETEIQLSEYHSNVLKNGGKLETIFKVKGNYTQEKLEEVEKKYNEKYSLAKNAGKPLFMTGDLELVTAGLKPAELAFLETKISALNDIVLATGVPRILLSLGSEETYANADAQIRTFYADTIRPIVEERVEVLNWRLIPDEFELSFLDPTPENVEQQLDILKAGSSAGALSVNEKREILRDLGLDIEELIEKSADEVYIPSNLTQVYKEDN